jgi:spermidine/putrescine transport system substrate-binding protein
MPIRYRPPLSVESAELLRLMTTSRRGLLRGALGGGALLAGAGLAGCGTKAATQTAASCRSTDLSKSQKVINFSNWPLYIDVDDKDKNKRPTLDAFTRQTGITVNYTEDINDNNEFFGKIRNQLAECQSTGRDIIVLTDWMAARLVRLGWVQKLDPGAMPNVEANLRTALRKAAWDPHRAHAIPWQSGLTGIAYNASITKPVHSFTELLTRSDLKGKVTLLSEMRDTMLFMLRVQGDDPEKFTADQYGRAIDRLQKAVSDGQIRRFTGNDYAQDLASGDIAACEAWSGDVIQLQLDNPKIKFVVPDEGLSLWSDNMMVPNKATHKANAEKLMNYYYEPKVAAELAAYVNYICPVDGAQQAMESIDKSLAANPLIFPDDATLAKAYSFMALTESQESTYEKQFQQVIGA